MFKFGKTVVAPLTNMNVINCAMELVYVGIPVDVVDIVTVYNGIYTVYLRCIIRCMSKYSTTLRASVCLCMPLKAQISLESP